MLSSIAAGNTMVMMNNPTTSQPVMELSEMQMQPAFHLQLQLPSVPPLMQSAYAVSSFTFNDNFANDCEEFPGNDDFIGNCDIPIFEPIAPVTQDPSGTSNRYDATINVDALNDCDEFNAGVNDAECINDADYVLGPVTQTNVPNVNPVGTNEVDYVTDDFLLNGCDEAGVGDNNAVCNNTPSNAFDSITQLNEVVGTVGVNFVESNTADILQGFDVNNDCDEEGDGSTAASCDNDVDNIIGPIDQSNDVSSTNPNAYHSNTIEVTQTGAARNACDESGAGTGTNDAHCDNEGENTFGDISNNVGVDQANFADGPDNAAQTNDFSVSQAFDVENNCDEFEEGTNTVFCEMLGLDNEIGDDDPVSQSNSASGSVGATITQNNDIDGDDALGIAGITQVIVAANTCGQTGAGDNLASCRISDFENDVDDIDQSNSVLDADDGTVISQDNGAVISQVLSLENDCDENTFNFVLNNNADCDIVNDMENFLGTVSQGNEVVSALDNSVSNQANNVAVSQDLLAENDCNGTGGNLVECTIDADADVNDITSIDQFNTATLAGDTLADQINDLSIGQTTSLVNTCDETDGGVNQALCENVAAENLVGPVSQSNTVNAPDSDNAIQSNGAEVAQILDTVNDCDEAGTGFNFATCSNNDDNFGNNNEIDSITQTNDATVGDDLVQLNFVAASQDLQLVNVCDETGLGDNNAICSNDIINNEENNVIGPVGQSNTATGSGDADFTQNNNIPAINQVLDAQNDCDQTDEQTASGDNNAICTNDDAINEISSITQTNDATGTHVDDIFQDNTGSFSQVMTLANGCDATTFTDSGDNDAGCSNDIAINFIGAVAQTNTATGGDDVLIDQDNNIAFSQAITANNDCDSTAENDAQCFNFDPINDIGSITQTNDATGVGFAQILQGNDAAIVQNNDALNSCDESGAGINDAFCSSSFAPENQIGPIDQSNTAAGAAQSDTVDQSNGAQITQDADSVNDCDEENTGDNIAVCTNNLFIISNIESITQTNDVTTVGDDTVQSDFVGIIQDVQLANVCDETGIGDNTARCSNDNILGTRFNNDIGPVDQSNTVTGSSDADFTQNNNIPTINQVVSAQNDCDQSDEQAASGNNNRICSNDDALNDIDSITQTNDATGTHVDDIFQDNTGSFSQVMTLANGCDATTFSDSGDNSAVCSNNDALNFMGAVDQTNTATGNDDVLIDQDNNLDVSQVLTANNDCDATALNDAFCSNFSIETTGNQISSITQDNTGTGDGFAAILQTNDATIAQNVNLFNSCDESGAGHNEAVCFNNDDFTLFSPNSIGPVAQTNTASGAAQSDSVLQSNDAQVTQNFQGTNDCDEENTGSSFATCFNSDTSINNIDSITQTNGATGGDDTVQLSFVGINQELQFENVCDETGLGDISDSSFCVNNYQNSIGPVVQDNVATGSGDADFTQNNNIPTINQVITAQNDCDQTDAQSAGGSNLAQCSNNSQSSDPSNDITSITQDNDATGTHVDDIFQDNTGSFSQVMTLANGCDATTFTDSGDNSAICSNHSEENDIGAVAQTNTATGNDDVLIDQDNNLDVSQTLTANNDCDSTAQNDVECSNDEAGNFIGDITQENIATGDDFASITQSNDAVIDQNVDLLNSCDESGAGINSASCDNESDPALFYHNLIGPVEQTNDATGAGNSVATQSNVIDVTQNLEGTNDCDEANTGDNDATCSTTIFNNIDSITQSNLISSITGTTTEDQSNVFTVNQNLEATNDCDESGDGDNNAVCTIIASNDIGIIDQSNTGSSNTLTITQNGQYTNDCDDTTSGDNDANCSITHDLVVTDRTQTGGGVETITQNENLVNTCPPGGGACNLSLLTVFDPNAVQLALADLAQEREQDEQEGEEKEVSDSLTTTFSALTTAAETEEDDKDKDDTSTSSGSIASVSSNSNVDDEETSDPEDSETQTVNKADTTDNGDTSSSQEEEEDEEEEQKDDSDSNTGSSSQEEEEEEEQKDDDGSNTSSSSQEEEKEEEEEDDEEEEEEEDDEEEEEEEDDEEEEEDDEEKEE